MEDLIFDIAFVHDSQTYEGWINPSEKLNDQGVPASFHAVVNGTFFGHLSFQNCNWNVSEERPAELVKVVGRQIEKYYLL